MGNDFFAIVLRWGRKDGFPGSSGNSLNTTIPIYGASGNTLTEGSTGVRKVNITTSGVLNGNTSKIYAIKNPLAFIYNATSLGDWYTNNQSSQDNTLWEEGEGKNPYDPCPIGWRVPTNPSFTYDDLTGILSLQNNNDSPVTNGGLYKDLVWFPAEGYRKGSNGDIVAAGVAGYNWCSTIETTGARYLFFHVLFGVNTHSGLYPRAQGLPVRCVQE